MRLELLQYFMTVAKCSSINTAAKELYISQQGLDSALRRLETELDTILFTRSRNGVHLTEEGELLQKYAEEILHTYTLFQIDLAKKKLQNQKDAPTLTILINPLYTNVLAAFLEPFIADCAPLNCAIYETPNERIPELISSASSDYELGIMSYCLWPVHETTQPWESLAASQLTAQIIQEDEVVLFLGRQNPLAVKEFLTDDDLLHTEIILSNNTLIHYQSLSPAASVLLDSRNYRLHQYYLTTRNCLSCLPLTIGQYLFDPEKVTFCRHSPSIAHKTILISKKRPSQYDFIENLFFNALQVYMSKLQ